MRILNFIKNFLIFTVLYCGPVFCAYGVLEWFNWREIWVRVVIVPTAQLFSYELVMRWQKRPGMWDTASKSLRDKLTLVLGLTLGLLFIGGSFQQPILTAWVPWLFPLIGLGLMVGIFYYVGSDELKRSLRLGNDTKVAEIEKQ
jgi:hypothetical protein